MDGPGRIEDYFPLNSNIRIYGCEDDSYTVCLLINYSMTVLPVIV